MGVGSGASCLEGFFFYCPLFSRFVIVQQRIEH